MSTWNKVLYVGLGAVLGGAMVYYRTHKDTEGFQAKLDNLNERSKEGCDSIREWFAGNQTGDAGTNS